MVKGSVFIEKDLGLALRCERNRTEEKKTMAGAGIWMGRLSVLALAFHRDPNPARFRELDALSAR